MNKQTYIIIFSLMLSLQGISQTRDRIVYDPTLNATIITETALEVEIQGEIHTQEEKIVDLQRTIASCQAIVTEIENKTYKYLSTASDIISVAYYIRGMTTDIQKSKDNIVDCINIVADEPYLAIITMKIDTLITSRIADLFAYVTDIAFVYDSDYSGGERPKNLLNNAERMEFVYHVSNELKVIRGYTAYLKSYLQIAKKQTVFQNLCPQTYTVVRNCQFYYDRILHNFNL